MHPLEQRIERLERQSRRYRLIMAGLCLAAVVAVTMAAAPDASDVKADEVTCRHLKVVNDEGKTVAEIRPLTDGVMVALNNQDGVYRMSLGVGEQGGNLVILNGASSEGIKLHIDEHGDGRIDVWDRNRREWTVRPQ
jgi:hypothetical protein